MNIKNILKIASTPENKTNLLMSYYALWLISRLPPIPNFKCLLPDHSRAHWKQKEKSRYLKHHPAQFHFVSEPVMPASSLRLTGLHTPPVAPGKLERNLRAVTMCDSIFKKEILSWFLFTERKELSLWPLFQVQYIKFTNVQNN